MLGKYSFKLSALHNIEASYSFKLSALHNIEASWVLRQLNKGLFENDIRYDNIMSKKTYCKT